MRDEDVTKYFLIILIIIQIKCYTERPKYCKKKQTILQNKININNNNVVQILLLIF